MAERTIRVIMNGVTGRMGYRQHLVRSVLAIRDDGGVSLADGDRITVEPILVGRNAEKLAGLAAEHGVADFTTNLDEALSDDSASIYFDAQVTSERKKSILKAVGVGKHIYTEKPIAESVDEGIELVTAAREAGVINGVVHDKLYLPGLIKLKRLIDAGFFGRILSVRGEFGYWVFEGDLLPAQRPSWNYRAEDGGGMVLDMFPHWNYVLENLFGPVQAVTAKAVTHIPERWDEQGRKYAATADDAGRQHRTAGADCRLACLPHSRDDRGGVLAAAPHPVLPAGSGLPSFLGHARRPRPFRTPGHGCPAALRAGRDQR